MNGALTGQVTSGCGGAHQTREKVEDAHHTAVLRVFPVACPKCWVWQHADIPSLGCQSRAWAVDRKLGMPFPSFGLPFPSMTTACTAAC
eukprot:366189-Chlamydomonas_euryale.AAC.8